MASVLNAENYDVVLARTGREAVAKFLAGPPDLVLLDIHMPEKNGWDVFDFIVAFQRVMPFIVISGQPEEYRRAVGFGIDAFMEKPLDLPLLLQAISDLLAESEHDRLARLTDRDFKTAYLGAEHETQAASLQPQNLAW